MRVPNSPDKGGVAGEAVDLRTVRDGSVWLVLLPAWRPDLMKPSYQVEVTDGKFESRYMTLPGKVG